MTVHFNSNIWFNNIPIGIVYILYVRVVGYTPGGEIVSRTLLKLFHLFPTLFLQQGHAREQESHMLRH